MNSFAHLSFERQSDGRPEIREDSRFGWLIIFIPSRATTTVSAALRAELHLAEIVVCQLQFSDRCF